MASAAIWQWYKASRQQLDLIVVTTTTNHAIQNVVRSFLEFANDLPERAVVFVQSAAAELQLTIMKDKAWRDCRLSELLKELLENKKTVLEKEEKFSIEEYVTKGMKHNGENFKEYFAFDEVLFYYYPKIIFGTTAMITKFAEQIAETGYQATKLIIDEASSLTHLSFLSLILQFPELNQIFLTGDIQQLPPYLGTLLELAREVGHNSCSENLFKSDYFC